MKIIFLDVDGVLNAGMRVREGTLGFEIQDWVLPKAVEHLNRITDATGAKLVISSTWRLGKTLSELKEMFARVGVTGEVISKTERGECSWHHRLGAKECYQGHRGAEIHDWLTQKVPPGERVESFVILDDSSDMLPYHDRHVHTDLYIGLSRRKANAAIKLLVPWFGRKEGKCDDTACSQCFPLPTL